MHLVCVPQLSKHRLHLTPLQSYCRDQEKIVRLCLEAWWYESQRLLKDLENSHSHFHATDQAVVLLSNFLGPPDLEALRSEILVVYARHSYNHIPVIYYIRDSCCMWVQITLIFQRRFLQLHKPGRLHFYWNSKYTQGRLLTNGHWDRPNMAREFYRLEFYLCQNPLGTFGGFHFAQQLTWTPRWLATQGQLKKAELTIAPSRSYSIIIKAAEEHTNRFVQAEVILIANQVEMENPLNAGWIACFIKTLSRRFLGMLLQSLQELTGANYFFHYGATIFQWNSRQFHYPRRCQL